MSFELVNIGLGGSEGSGYHSTFKEDYEACGLPGSTGEALSSIETKNDTAQGNFEGRSIT